MSNNPAANANVPQIPQPIADVGALAVAVQQIKQGVDSLGGNRGHPNDRAVTFNDLLKLGMVSTTGTTGSSTSGVVAVTTAALPVIGPQNLLGLGGAVSAQATSIALAASLSINAGGSLVVTFPSAVTTVVAGTGLAGGTITSTGTISLGTIPAGQIMGNPGALAAVPAGVTVGAGLSLNALGTLFATGTGVTTVVAGAGLAGGTITTTGTISLGTIAAGQLMGNPSVGAAVPAGVTVGAGLALSTLGTLTAQWQGGSVTAVSQGLTVTSNALNLILQGYINGVQLTTASTSTVTVGAGMAMSDDNTTMMVLGSALTKSISGTWVVGNNSNGLDAGVVAITTWYHIWLIYNPTSLITDVLISTSATSPTLPTGYTKKRRIGVQRTGNPANLFTLLQNGDRFDLVDPITLAGAATVFGNTTANTVTLFTPTGVVTEAIVHVLIFDSVAQSGLIVTSLAQGDIVASGANGVTAYTPGAAGELGEARFTVMTDTSANVRMRATTATLSAYITTWGWYDRRGRL